MSGEDRVGQMRGLPLVVGDRDSEPAVVLLTTQPEHLAAERDPDPVSCEFPHEWEEPFPGRFAWDR